MKILNCILKNLNLKTNKLKKKTPLMKTDRIFEVLEDLKYTDDGEVIIPKDSLVVLYDNDIYYILERVDIDFPEYDISTPSTYMMWIEKDLVNKGYKIPWLNKLINHE